MLVCVIYGSCTKDTDQNDNASQDDNNSYSRKSNCNNLKLIRTVPERIHTVGTGLVILDAIREYFSATHMRIFTQGVREGFMVKQLEIDFPELAPLGLKL